VRNVHREIAAGTSQGGHGQTSERLFSDDARVLAGAARDDRVPQLLSGCALSTSRVSKVEKILSPSLSASTQAPSIYFLSPASTLSATQCADILSKIFSPFMFWVVPTASSGDHELYQTFGARQILQVVLAQVPRRDVRRQLALDQVERCPRERQLAAVSGRAHAGCAVHVQADVFTSGARRLASVESHRTRTAPSSGQECAASALCPSIATATPSIARPKTTKKPSPGVSTSWPPWAPNGARRSRRCSSSTSG
jgi:hypothetical protein